MNKKYIVANWKMNPTSAEEARSLAQEIQRVARAEIILCPPFPFLHLVRDAAPGVSLGAQDCFWEQEGAYTGEVSPAQLKSMGCSYVLLGHSERRIHLGETREMVNKKVQAALGAGLIPIVLIGEEDRSQTGKGLADSMERVLAGVSKEDRARLFLVYEPVWAISTSEGGEPARPEEAKEAIGRMREAACGARILYGGSVDASNAASFLRDGEADGVAVGSASLRAQEFLQLVKQAEEV
ncbi:MAG: triose-phosphate isomerase [Candidatus Yanofskybacteria bacterium]|nr:triose-phosphate isomerase [Candidatus Yanofskybacteria bacterium]